MNDLEKIIKAEKRITSFPGWSKSDPSSGYIWFDVPIEIDGIVETGLVLHGGCFENRPDCHVTLELRISRSATGTKRIPIERLDWRSLEGGHSNPRRKNNRWSGRTVSNTHLHAFELNWSDEMGRMKSGNLKMAMEVTEKLESFEEVIDFMKKRLNINNLNVVKKPEWVYDLFGGMI